MCWNEHCFLSISPRSQQKAQQPALGSNRDWHFPPNEICSKNYNPYFEVMKSSRVSLLALLPTPRQIAPPIFLNSPQYKLNIPHSLTLSVDSSSAFLFPLSVFCPFHSCLRSLFSPSFVSRLLKSFPLCLYSELFLFSCSPISLLHFLSCIVLNDLFSSLSFSIVFMFLCCVWQMFFFFFFLHLFCSAVIVVGFFSPFSSIYFLYSSVFWVTLCSFSCLLVLIFYHSFTSAMMTLERPNY